MTGRIDAKLKELGIELPQTAAPVANYVPWVRTGAYVYISGQIPLKDGRAQAGIVGKDLNAEQARASARQCAVNILSALKGALDGDLDRVIRCVKLTGFVNAVPGFGNHPEVINGASDLIVEVLGDAGRHTRAAVGAGSLPRNVPVEIDAVFEVK